MKTKFKTLISMLTTVLLLFVVTSCSKDTDPADTDIFAGVYSGTISYLSVNPSKRIGPLEGKVTVTKLGSSYSFHFDNGIPDLTGVKFEKKDDNTYIGIGSGFSGITINASSLHMLVTKDGETWTADCHR